VALGPREVGGQEIMIFRHSGGVCFWGYEIGAGRFRIRRAVLLRRLFVFAINELADVRTENRRGVT
jgi:hypothetical protein